MLTFGPKSEKMGHVCPAEAGNDDRDIYQERQVLTEKWHDGGDSDHAKPRVSFNFK
jgi:hypothetical protein